MPDQTAAFTLDALPDPALIRELAELAERIAIEAGELTERYRAEGVEVADTKSSSVDIVTAADRAAEELIRARLAAARPGDGFYGEESDPSASATGLVWVVDPIDGTVNYLYGHAQYGISIAVVVGDPAAEPAAYETVAGVVRLPARGVTYRAERGGGATADGRVLRASAADGLECSLVATGFSYDAERRRHQARIWTELAGEVRDLRRVGAASLDLCGVAAGRLDAYYEAGTHPWDHAAGALLVREAGGVVTGRSGQREGRTMVVATAPGIAEAFRGRLAEAEAAVDA